MRSSIAILRLGVDILSPSSVNISNTDRLLEIYARRSLSFVCSRSWLAFSANYNNQKENNTVRIQLSEIKKGKEGEDSKVNFNNREGNSLPQSTWCG